MITLASHVFEYFLRFLLQACVICAFWLRWGSHGVTPPTFLPTLTFTSRAVPLLGFLGFFGVSQSYSCIGVDRHDDYSADASARLALCGFIGGFFRISCFRASFGSSSEFLLLFLGFPFGSAFFAPPAYSPLSLSLLW